MSPISFYSMTIREANLTLEGYRNRLKTEYNLQLMAAFNAKGYIDIGKKFKPINPFEYEEKASKTPEKTSIEEQRDTLSYLKNKFN